MRILTIWAVLVAAFCATCSAGEWQNIGPGGGGWVPTMAISPVDSRVVYAGCDVGGFYLSQDAGENWVIHNQGLHDYYVEVIAPHPRDPKILYVGTEGGVHRSTDGGNSWQLLSEGFPPRERWSFSAPVGALAIDPQNPQTLYAGIGRPRWGNGGKGAIYRSDDAGAHWKLANPGGTGMDPQAIVRDLLINPQTATIFAATDHGLYTSTDHAATWKHIGDQLPAPTLGRIAFCQARPQTMYVSVLSPAGQSPRTGGVYRSDDAGRTWTACNHGLADRVGKPGEPSEMTSNIDRLVVHPTNPDIVYAGDTSWVSAGVYRTTDGGKTWRNLTDNMDRGWIKDWGPTVMGMALDPQSPDTLYFSTSGQIYRTADRGEHWTPRYAKPAPPPPGAPASAAGYWAGTGAETTCLNSIAVHPRDANHLYICYMDIGLLQSFDAGRTFTRTVEGMRHRGNTFRVVFDPADPQIIYAGTGEWGSNHGDVCKSEDGGQTWKVVGKPETGLPDGQTYRLLIDPDSPQATRRLFVAVTGSGVYCSEDSGRTWQPRNQGLPNTSIRDLAAHPTQKGTLFALLGQDKATPGGLYRSTDHGLTWKQQGTETWPDAKSLAISPSDPQRLYVAARETTTPDGQYHPGGAFASSDGGLSWHRIHDDHFIQAIVVDPVNPDILYIGGNDHPFHDDALGLGVLCSRDGGKTWTSLNDSSLSVRKIPALTLDTRPDPSQPSRLYAGTGGNGVFVRQIPSPR